MDSFRPEHIPQIILFSSSFLGFLLCASMALTSRKAYEKFLFIAIHFSLSVMIMEHVLNNYYLSKNHGYLLNALLGWMEFYKILIGPLFLLYYQYYTGIGQHFRLRYLLHFIPFVIVSLMILGSASGIFRFDLLLGHSICDLFDTEAAVHQVVYLFIILIDFLSVHVFGSINSADKNRTKSCVRPKLPSRWFTQVGAYFVIGVWGILLSMMFIFSKDKFFDLLAIMSPVIIIHYSFFVVKNAGLSGAGSRLRAERYATISKSGVSDALLAARLDDLMTKEKVWLDEELSLPSLAALMLVSTHRLSAFINDSCRMNFKTYINSFRIEEAKRLLEHEPEWSVLRIALMAGFNSKSVFYRVFTAETGISPNQYRESLKS